MKNWKTTISGACASAGAAMIGAGALDYISGPEKALVMKIGFFLTVAGLFFKGLFAADASSLPPSGTSAALVLCAALGLSMGSGCSSTPQRVAYNTIGATEITVDQAMSAWGDYVAQFHPPASDENKVAIAYSDYQLAAELAVDAAEEYQTLAVSDPAKTAAKAKADQAAQVASRSLSDLVGLLQGLGVKL